jgi:hypothetical protein
MEPRPRLEPVNRKEPTMMDNRVKEAISKRIDDSETKAQAATAHAAGTASVRDRPSTAPIPRIALARDEAAAALGLSVDSFERHVQPDLSVIRPGELWLVSVRELERWADTAAERTV